MTDTDAAASRRWPRDVRVVALRMLPWIVVISIVGALSYLRLLDLRLTPLRNSARLLIEQGVSVTTSELGNLARDTMVLGQSPALTNALSSGQPAAAVGTALLIHARASRPYAAITWIDENGRERARIDNRDGIASLVEPARLLRPAQMPWLKGMLELLPAEARFTPVDVQEGNAWLRVASPVYDMRGRQRGMVVIHHDFKRTLAQIHMLDTVGPDPLQLLGPEGQAIGLESKGDNALSAQAPGLWHEITLQGRGRREGEDGMWFYQDFLPAEPGPGRMPLQAWYFVAHVPAQAVQELRQMSALQSGSACALVLCLVGIATVRRRQIEREREQLLADLQANHLALAAAKAEVDTSLTQLQQLQAELVQAEKLASLGLLVAGVAHELNTPIGSAKVTASTMARRLGDAERRAAEAPLEPAQWLALLANQRAGLDIIDHSLERSGQVIRLFKQLAVDRGAVERRRFALDDLMQDVQRLLATRLREAGVSLSIELAPHVTLDSYPGPLGQVIENLIVNAVMHAFDPVPGGASHPRRVNVQCHTEAVSRELQIDVTDNGNGIDPLIMPRIFDPFFTTRRGRGGTGIGLHLCHHFCTQLLGGRISADSTARTGSRFTVRIPLQAP